MPSVATETSLRDEIGRIDVNFRELDELFLKIEAPESPAEKLEIYLRKSAPTNAPFLFRKSWRSSIRGLYLHSSIRPQIHINIPLIQKLEEKNGHTRTFLHEVGHFVDFHKTPVRPGRLDYGLLGSWISTTIAPPAYYYAERGDILMTSGVGLISFLASSAALGALLEVLDKKRLGFKGRNEGVADDFADEYTEQYPQLISIS